MSPAVARRWCFAPRLVPTLAAAFFFALTFALGQWQTGRAAEKRGLQARYDSADATPALSANTGFDAGDALYRRVVARGVWDDAHTVLLDNRVYRRVAGYHVLTPLKLDNDRVLLVNRGWLPVGVNRESLPAWITPRGVVSVEGIALPPQSRYVELGNAAPQGRLWQNLDFDAYAKTVNAALLPVLVQQTSAAPDRLIRDWPRPDAGADMHVGYAFQWYALSATLAALWLGLNLRRVPVTPDNHTPRSA
jgi:surfeit locus 1 family protein